MECNTGVQQIAENEEGIKVYPNPSGGTFTVEAPKTTGKTFIIVTDVLGKAIDTRGLDGNTEKAVLQLFNAAAGSYFVKVSTGGKTYHTKLVIW